MAKREGKKSTIKGKDIGQPNSRMKKRRGRRVNPRNAPAPAPGDTAEAIASDLIITSDPTSSNNGSATGVVDNEKGIHNRLSGFIFMCNSRTKVECYQYRVFGLPSGKKEVVEEIKPGAKLFLFDFELKLCYGIYEATSAGTLNLEPAVFGGKFPAQVKFKIFKECLPLPGSNLRHLIKENYSGSKFKQELNGNQVNRLLSSFQPLNASSSQLALQAPPNLSQLQAMPPSARGYQLNHTMRAPPLGVPYLTETQYGRTAQLQPSTVSNVHYTQQGYHRPANDTGMVHRTLNHQSYPATGGYYVANSQQTYFTGGVACEVHGPYSRTIVESVYHDYQVTNMGRQQYHQLPPLQRQPVYKDNNVVAYNAYQQVPAQYTSSVAQPASALYASSVAQPASALYASSVMQPQHPPPGSYYSYSGATR